MKKFLIVFALAALAVTTSACREEERNLPLSDKKGVYEGQADQPIPPATMDKLRDRMRLQSGGTL